MPTIELTTEQAEILAHTLESYVSDLRMEIASTDLKDFRDELKHRRQVLDEVRAQLRRD